jgi:hypothetical protein
MRPIALTAALILGMSAPLAAAASSLCEDLWVTRNMMFHRAGYCFSSPLGQTLFGNAGCRTADAGAVAVDREAVALMRQYEERCQINTQGGPTPGMWARKALLDRVIEIPTVDEFGYACWGYNGPGFALHAATSAQSPVIGVAQTRQSLLYSHWQKNGWAFIEVSNGPGTPIMAAGWAQGVSTQGLCDQEAD